MLKSRFCMLLLAAAPLLGHAGIFDDKEARKQIAETQQAVERLQQSMQQGDQQLSERLAQAEAALKGLKLTEVLNQLEAVRTEMAALRGQFELQTYQIEQLQKRQKDLYNDVDSRVRALEEGKSASLAAEAADPAVAEEKVYSDALAAYKKGDYAAAINGFQRFASSYADSKLAPNALYWTGAAQYAQQDCKAALATQQKLLSQYPESSKAPDALLGIATCQLEKNETVAARKTLQQVLTRFPASPAAEQAKKQLARLGSVSSGKK